MYLFQGYEKSLKALFVAAGLHMSQTKIEKERRELVAKEEQDDELQTGDFLTLDKCSQVFVVLSLPTDVLILEPLLIVFTVLSAYNHCRHVIKS